MPLSTTIIQLTPPALPAGYCPSSYQQLANDIVYGTTPQFLSSVGNTFFNTGASEPSADNRIYPWLDDDGNWWVYQGGKWARKHPIGPNDLDRRIYVGTTTQLETYDGGSAGAITTYTGPMWEVDSAFAARFPAGVGTFAASGALSVAQGSTATGISGTDQVTLTVAQIPEHDHEIAIQVPGYGGEDGARVAADGGTDSPNLTNNRTVFPGANLDNKVQAESLPTGGGTPHINLPPFYGVYFIKRTARVYYTK